MHHFKLLLIFLLVSIPAILALSHPGLFTSHDLEGHVIRLIEFDRSLSDGNFPVRWAKRLNWGIGYPYFNFNYPLVYYILVLIARAGFGYTDSLKLVFALTFPLSGFFTYLWLGKHFSKLAAIVGGLVYMYVPYHFLNTYVRGNVAEAMALTVAPLVFYFATKPGIGLAISLSCLVLLHNITTMLFIPILTGYVIITKQVRSAIFPVILAIFTTAFFWIPALWEKKFIILDTAFSKYFVNNFPDLTSLLYSPWGYGASKAGAAAGEMSLQIGLPQWGIIGAAALWLVKKRKALDTYIFIIALLSIGLMLKISLPVWKLATPLQYLQFPWRLLGVVVFACAYLAALVSEKLKLNKIWVPIILLLLMFFNRNHWRANEYYQLRPEWLNAQQLNSTTTVDGEHTPKWQNTDLSSYKRYEINTEGTAKAIIWNTNYHKFDTQLEKPGTFIDRTVYYPGWYAKMDGNKVSLVDKNNSDSQGLLAIALPAGHHIIETNFEETTLRKWANLISGIGILIVFLLIARKIAVRTLLK